MERVIQEVETSLAGLGYEITEGSASSAEMLFLADYMRAHARIKRVCEIGFNAGLSSWAFLMGRDDVEVASFDSMDHSYVQAAKKLLDGKFEGRHELVPGDSTVSVPQYARDHRGHQFDFVFVDGGHDFETAREDLLNCGVMSDEATVVMIDDLTPWEWWGVGPTEAWQSVVEEGLVVEMGLYRNGRVIKKISGRSGDRVWACGRYTKKALQRPLV